MTTQPQTRTIDIQATSRDAGRTVVHTVTGPVRIVRPTRRSATTRYRFAICRWSTVADTGERVVVVQRWSGSAKVTGSDFAVTVTAIDQPGAFAASTAAPSTVPPVVCRCGKTVIVDGFGRATNWRCPQCGDHRTR